MKRVVVMGFLSSILALFGCKRRPEEGVAQRPPYDARKQRTEAELKELGLVVNPWLAVLQSEEEARIRSAEDVARRAVVLYWFSRLAHGEDRSKTVEFLKAEGLWDDVTPKEAAVFEGNESSEKAMIDASWRIEGVWVLLWALGKIEALDFPKEMCDVGRIHEIMRDKSGAAEFVRAASVRSTSEILDDTDRIYRIHWAVRDAWLNGRPIPADLNPGVVLERHRALNWLIWYADEWDHVATDT